MTSQSPGPPLPEAVISVTRIGQREYPPGAFGPAEPFPEYSWADGFGANPIYAGVRQCLAALDPAGVGQADWNPLRPWMPAGSRVFVLPNFVTHRQPWEAPEQFAAKCTHASVLRPIVDYALLAAGPSGHVEMGNAPLQSCDHEAVLQATGADQLRSFYPARLGYEAGPHDLRQFVSRWTRYGAMLETKVRDPNEAVAIDLGRQSLLDPLYYQGARQDPRVRVGDYDPSLTTGFHSVGRHVYLVNRRLLESDVILSVPKLKTHQKVGITCALKGLVGTITRKECLAHHRLGGPADSGDEYAVSSPVHRLASSLADYAAHLGPGLLNNTVRVSSKVLYRSLRLGRGVTGGSWHGNDTAWRMVIDIARILRYARPDGTLAAQPQRRHIALIDGIVAGEGEGPLRPIPRPCGLLIFASDAVWGDLACALVMGFNPVRIPFLHHALESATGLTDAMAGGVRLLVDGKAREWEDLPAAFGLRFQPPKGWIGHLELPV